jgi:hypothetical protein
MQFIENRPIGCNMCGYNPVFGREDTYKRGRSIVTECRWVCPRCNNLIRVDENESSQEKED